MKFGKSAECPVIDMHGHMGPVKGIYFPAPGPGEMVSRMSRAGVEMLAFCHHSALYSPELANSRNIEAVRMYPGRLRAYCGVLPHYPELIESDLGTYDDYPDVYIGFKLLADYHMVPLSDGKYKKVLEFADDRRLLVLLHTWGGSRYNGGQEVEKVCARYRNARFILGHSLHGEWDEAAELASRHPNAYLELTAVMDERAGILEKFVSKAGSEKVVFGTDFPWFSHHYYIGAVLSSDISENDVKNILFRNARGLLSGF